MMSDPSPQHALVLFRVGPVFACADARPVVAIVLPPPLTRPPGSGGSRPGVFRHNSGLVRVVDLRERLGVAAEGTGTQQAAQTDRVIVVRLATGLFGFWVDSILGVIDRPAGGWGPLPPHLPRAVFPRTLLHREQIYLETDLARLVDWHDTPALHAAIRAYTTSQTAHVTKQTPPAAAPGTAAKTGKANVTGAGDRTGNNSASLPPVVARREPAPDVNPTKDRPADNMAGRPATAQAASAMRNSRTAPSERRTVPPRATTPFTSGAANRSASPAGTRRTAGPANGAADRSQDGSKAGHSTGLHPGVKTAPAPHPGIPGRTASPSRANSSTGNVTGAAKSRTQTASATAWRGATVPSSARKTPRPAPARPVATQRPDPASTMPPRPAIPRPPTETMSRAAAGGTHPPAAAVHTTDTAGSGAVRIGVALLGLGLFAVLLFVLLGGHDEDGQIAGSSVQPPPQDITLALTPPVAPGDADSGSTPADEADGESGGETTAQTSGMASVVASMPSPPSATASRPVPPDTPNPETSTPGTPSPITLAPGTPAVVAHPPALPPAQIPAQTPAHGPTETASAVTTLAATHSANSGVPEPHASLHRDREGLVIVLDDTDETGSPASGPTENVMSAAPARSTTPPSLTTATAPAAETTPPAPVTEQLTDQATARISGREANPGPTADNAASATAEPPAAASGAMADATPGSADAPGAQNAGTVRGTGPDGNGRTDGPAPDARSDTPPASHIVTTEIVHIVVPGDTLWAIAEHYIHNPFRYPELARLSRIRNPDLIYPGDRVRIIHRHRVDTSGAGKQPGSR